MANVATQGPVGSQIRRTYAAQAASMGKGYVVVQGNSDTNAVIASAANAVPIGINDESTVNIGDAVTVITSGETEAVIGAAVASGQFVVSDALGRVVPATNVNGQNIVGQARTSGTTAGDEIILYVSPDAGPGGQDAVTHAIVSGAIPVATGTTGLGSAAALAMTLVQPTAAQDGTQIFVTAETAKAHTITTPANGINGSKHIVTFTNQGDGVVLEALATIWNVRALIGAAALS